MDALLQILRLKNPQTILEVGAAIGYSALRMAEALPDVNIVTIERDEERIGVAKENIRKACAQDRVMLIEGDALTLRNRLANLGLLMPFLLMLQKANTENSSSYTSLF